MSKLLIYLKNNFICGLAYLITRHKKEYIFLNRNFSRLLLKFYKSDEESVSSDSSNNHCNSLEYTYQLFVALLINWAIRCAELQRNVLRISLRTVLSRSVNLSTSKSFIVEVSGYFELFPLASDFLKTWKLTWFKRHYNVKKLHHVRFNISH